MPRLGILDLPKPDSDYRIVAGVSGFETNAMASKEAHTRIRQLRQTAKAALDEDLARASKTLAHRLEHHLNDGKVCESPACPLCMRRYRKRVGGNLWQLVEHDHLRRPVTATLLPRGAEVPAGDLNHFGADGLKAALRSDLNRCGANDADGFLFAALHGEFEPTEEVYRLHWHLLISGGMIEVVDRLRDRPKYRSRRDDDEAVRQRVRIGRKSLEQLPRPLTYLLQSWWPSRWIGHVGDGEVKRQRQRTRIPEPHHSENLVWLDQQRIDDLVLLRRLRVTNAGFTAA